MNPATLREDLLACRAIVRQAVLQRRSQGSMWLSWTLAGLTVLFAVLALFKDFASEDARLLCVGVAGVAFSMLAIMWWTLLSGSIAQQYTAFAARLLPRARQRMRAVLLSAGLLLALAEVLLVGLPSGHPVLVFFGAVFMMIEIVLPTSWLAAAPLLFVVADKLVARVPDWWMELLGSPAGAVLGFTVLAFEARAANRRLFGANGSLPPSRTPALAQRDPRPASQARPGSSRAALLVYGLGPTPPWRQCLRSLAFWAMAAIMFGLMMLWGGGLRVQLARALILCVVLVGQFTSVHMIVGTLYESRREQSLIRLSAAAPQASMLNRVLARVLVAQAVWVWIASLAAAVAAFWLTGASWSQTLQAGALCALTPFACGGLLAEYARARAVSRPSGLGRGAATVAGAVLVLVVSFGLAESMVFAAGAALVMLAGSVFALARWRGMLRAPAAFPAGRIG
ncbi:hypothetical protein NX774_19200 [Massilia agilis]|uniref:ABC-2 type transport system permease protein n=1 Tax=Massilia agilis TaxID=1811226 RepID=A0ABT2DFS3_9BURK|nr:hypothetical protein [Massilia agilis]MCS0810056.1 hypothetical protein [Massilia agilis]